jgi:hypothetical protein
MATTFNMGQTVTAKVTAQGMVAGSRYLIVGVSEKPTAFGTFATYWLSTVADLQLPAFAVCNLGLLADLAVDKLTPKQADAARRRERAAERRAARGDA